MGFVAGVHSVPGPDRLRLQAKGEGKRQVRFEEEFGECDGRRSPDQDGRRVFYRDSGVSLYGTTDSSDRRWPR